MSALDRLIDGAESVGFGYQGIAVEARAELAALRARAEDHDRLISTIREVTDRWCMTTDDYIVELQRIYAEYKRLRDADVAVRRAALNPEEARDARREGK